jgi:hypothetical protein
MLWSFYHKERERHEDVEGPDRPPVAGIGDFWNGTGGERGRIR